MKCPSCQAEIQGAAAFCPECGKPLPAQASESSATAASQQTLDGLRTVYREPEAIPTPASARLESGQVFHVRYRIERHLGEGGMGMVYLAHDQVTERPVVLKLIRPELVASESAVQRLLREGVLARDLRHPNIVGVYDVGVAEGLPYLTMEYAEGRTLRAWLLALRQRQVEMALETALGITREILTGLVAAHQAGVVHRDLKPENIMLLGDPAQGDYRLKILDFGVARAVGTEAQLTVAGAALGTPTYMAPEQVTGADTVGPQADLYPVAVMLYEMLLEVPPQGRWRLPSEIRADLPKGLDKVVEKGLEGYPRSRFQQASEFLDALDRVREAEKPEEQQEERTTPQPGAVQYATYQQRSRAGLIDFVIVFGGMLLLFGVIAGALEPMDEYQENLLGAWYLISSAFLAVGYFYRYHRGAGQTPGKRMVGIRVVGPGGAPLTDGQARRRAMGYLVSLATFGWGFWVMRSDPQGRAWHDRLAGTYVVQGARMAVPATPAPAATQNAPPARGRLFVGLGLGAAALVMAGIVASVMESTDSGAPGLFEPASYEPGPAADSRPAPTPEADLTGTWYDEQGLVYKFAQDGSEVTATGFSRLTGNRAGTLQGTLSNGVLDYGYTTTQGNSGRGRAEIESDGAHMSVVVRDSTTGMTATNRLHREHLPQ